MSIPTVPGTSLHHAWAFARDPLDQPTQWIREHGDLVRLKLPGAPLYLVSHPDHVEQVLVRDWRKYRKDSFTRKLNRLLGQGLVTSEGAHWKRQRKLANPGFDQQHIRGYADTMVQRTDAELDGWQDGQTRDLHTDMNRLTLDIVTRTLFGADLDPGDFVAMGAAIGEMMRWYMGVWNSGFTLPDFVPTPANQRAKAAVVVVDDIVNRIIERRRGDPGGDLLSMLMAAVDEDDGTGMTDQQLRDEAVTMIAAGHETTASALTFTLYLLAQHPEVEARLHAELETVLGDRPASFADVRALTWTTWVVQESMRLYPPVWGIGREALEPVDIGGEPLDTGSTLFLLQWISHRDPRWWPDAEAFHPQRWEGLRPAAGAYYPFSLGPRICIGKRFAMMEAVLVLATIARRVRLTLAPGEELKLMPSVTLRPKAGLSVVVAAR